MTQFIDTNGMGFTNVVLTIVFMSILVVSSLGYFELNQERLNTTTRPSQIESESEGTAGNANNSVSEGEVRFIGVIQDIHDARPVDGSLEIEVNNKRIEIATSGQIEIKSVGSLIGLTTDYSTLIKNNIGKKVEIFAIRSNPQDLNHFTIVGDRKYYVKVIQ